MPLTKKFSALYEDALIALAAASERPATVVNIDGRYVIRVDLKYNRHILATNSPRGLGDEPDASGSWWVRIMQTDDAGGDLVLTQAQKPWLIDAFDAAIDQLESDGHTIAADMDFGAILHADERLPSVSDAGSSDAPLS